MKKIHLFIWIVIFGGQLSAQTIEDLLYKYEQQTGKDKIETLFQIGQIYLKTAPPKAIFYLEKALAEAKKINNTALLIKVYLNLAEAIQEQYNYTIQYKAKEGELISDICKRFGITRKDLEAHNYLSKNENTIDSYGQTFTIASSLRFIQPIAFKQVCEYYEEALKLRRTQKNNNYLIFTLKKVGDFYTKEQQFAKAEKHYLEWLKIRRIQKDTTKLVWVLRYLADFYRESGQSTKAKKNYDEIIAIDKIRKNKNDFANTLAEISLIYPEPLRAEKYFHQALKFWIVEKNQTKIEWMRERERFSEFDVYFGEDKQEEKENYLLKHLRASKISMDTVLVYRAYKRLIEFYIREDRTYRAEDYLDSLWNFAIERKRFSELLTEKSNIIDILANYATYHVNDRYKNDFAVNYLYVFKNYYEKKEPETWVTTRVYEKLDYFYRKKEQYDSAAYFFKKRIIDKYPKYTNVEGLNDLAFLYQKANNYTDALLYFNKALDIQKTKQNPLWVSEQLNKIGYLYEQRLDVRKMNEYYQKALKNVIKLDSEKVSIDEKRSMDLALQFWRIGKLYEQQGNTKKAIFFTEKSIEISSELDIIRGRIRFHKSSTTRNLKKYLEKLKNKK